MRIFPPLSIFLFGVALGLSITTLAVARTDQIWSIVPTLVTALVAVAIAYWIHTTISTRRVLDNIPVRFLSEIACRIERGANASLDTSKKLEQKLEILANLSNEVIAFRRIARSWSPSDHAISGMQKALFNGFVKLKRSLTDEPPDPSRAVDASRDLHAATLKLQMSLSARILDGRIDRNTFMG